MIHATPRLKGLQRALGPQKREAKLFLQPAQHCPLFNTEEGQLAACKERESMRERCACMVVAAAA